MLKKLGTALVVGALTLVPVASAQAATASHTVTVNGPVVYETNRIYDSPNLNAPAGTSSAGRISSIKGAVEWVSNERLDITTKVCTFTSASPTTPSCVTIPLSSTKNFTTTAFNNLPATQSFFFRFQIPTDSPNKVLKWAEYPGKNTLTVTYNTP